MRRFFSYSDLKVEVEKQFALDQDEVVLTAEKLPPSVPTEETPLARVLMSSLGLISPTTLTPNKSNGLPQL